MPPQVKAWSPACSELASMLARSIWSPPRPEKKSLIWSMPEPMALSVTVRKWNVSLPRDCQDFRVWVGG